MESSSNVEGAVKNQAKSLKRKALKKQDLKHEKKMKKCSQDSCKALNEVASKYCSTCGEPISKKGKTLEKWVTGGEVDPTMQKKIIYGRLLNLHDKEKYNAICILIHKPEKYITMESYCTPGFAEEFFHTESTVKGKKNMGEMIKSVVKTAFKGYLEEQEQEQEQQSTPAAGSTDIVVPSTSTDDFSPPGSTDIVVPSTSTEDFSPPGSTDIVVPSTSTEDFSPPGSTDIVVPSTSTEDFSPPGSTDIVVPSTSTEDFSPPGSTDIVVPSGSSTLTDDFSPPGSTDIVVPSGSSTLTDIFAPGLSSSTNVFVPPGSSSSTNVFGPPGSRHKRKELCIATGVYEIEKKELQPHDVVSVYGNPEDQDGIQKFWLFRVLSTTPRKIQGHYLIKENCPEFRREYMLGTTWEKIPFKSVIKGNKQARLYIIKMEQDDQNNFFLQAATHDFLFRSCPL
ncbi:uncharacterized protein [Clytia hemisphaerica]|uniref:uncharacterized protein isoform X4 n=1 Tax=Clytia hemisphaerica TaxID=252671 RepID=UPI0034D426EC